LALVVGLAVFAHAGEARAFRGCEDKRDGDLYKCWPEYGAADRPAGTTPSGNGTQRWSFCYKVDAQGLELQDLAFNGVTVAKKISLAYLLTRSSATPSASPNCTSTNVAANNTPQSTQIDNPQAEMGCVHVP